MGLNGKVGTSVKFEIEELEEHLPSLRPSLRAFKRDKGSDLDVGLTRIDDEMELVRHQGLFGMWRLRWEAWLEEKIKDPAIRKMKARQEILEQQRITAEAQIRLKSTVQSGDRQVEVGRMEHSQVLWQRLQTDMQHSGILLPGLSSVGSASGAVYGSSEPPVSLHITDEQIEALALRAVMSIGKGEGAEAEWQQYRTQLYERLPQYAAQEVERRVFELRKVAA